MVFLEFVCFRSGVAVVFREVLGEVLLLFAVVSLVRIR